MDPSDPSSYPVSTPNLVHNDLNEAQRLNDWNYWDRWNNYKVYCCGKFL
jgi:hypothetical protein